MQVFAAFNLGRPNHFLKPSGEIAEQVKTREWLVARITDISEGLVDADDPTSNPYGLQPGSKYFMLDAEPYVTKSQIRSSTGAKHAGVSRSSSERHVQSASAGAAPLEERKDGEREKQRRRASASDVLRRSMAGTQTEPSIDRLEQVSTPTKTTGDLAGSAFSVIGTTGSMTGSSPPVRMTPQRSASTPIAPSSNLSAARPANLAPVLEDLHQGSSPVPILDLQGKEASITFSLDEAEGSPFNVKGESSHRASGSLGSPAPASLPASTAILVRRIGTPSPATASAPVGRQLSTSIPRSIGSSTGSGGAGAGAGSMSSSSLHKRMSSSLLRTTSGKGTATIATTSGPASVVDENDDRSWLAGSFVRSASTSGGVNHAASSPLRLTAPIGRYSGRKNRQAASVGAGTPSADGMSRAQRRYESVSSSTSGTMSRGAAEDLLRSFTTDRF